MREYSVWNFQKNNENLNKSEREKKITEKINTNYMNNEEFDALKQIIHNYEDLFYLEGDVLSHTNAITHEINLVPGSKPIHVKQYRLPLSQREEINRQVEKMLDDGVITPSNSEWNSPLILVPRKSSTDEKKFRVVVDSRKLNEITIGDSFPIPNINDILDSLGHVYYFSCLDLAWGYHQVVVDPAHRKYTAFSVGSSTTNNNNKLGDHYELTRLLFGLKPAPMTFCRLMKVVTSGLLGIACLIYLDDIIIFSHDLKSHVKNIELAFDRLIQHNLKLNSEKCTFFPKKFHI